MLLWTTAYSLLGNNLKQTTSTKEVQVSAQFRCCCQLTCRNCEYTCRHSEYTCRELWIYFHQQSPLECKHIYCRNARLGKLRERLLKVKVLVGFQTKHCISPPCAFTLLPCLLFLLCFWKMVFTRLSLSIMKFLMAMSLPTGVILVRCKIILCRLLPWLVPSLVPSLPLVLLVFLFLAFPPSQPSIGSPQSARLLWMGAMC